MFKMTLTISFFFITFNANSAVNNFISNGFVDGPALATYERTATSLKVYVDLPKQGGHASYTLNSSAPNTNGGSYIAPKSVTSGSTVKPQIASNVKIPLSGGVGSAVSAVLTVPVLKSGMAKAAVALMRASPYVSAAVSLGWLANAGYQYISSTDSFQTLSTGTPTGSITGQCRMQSGTIISNTYTMQQCLDWYSSGTTLTVSNVTKADACNYNATLTGTNGIPTQRNPWWTNWSPCTDDTNPTGAVIAPAYPKTPEQTIDALTLKPITGTVDTPQTIDNELGELIKAEYIPEKDPATPNKLTGPNGETTITTPGGTTTTAEPDGSVVARRLEYQTRFADDRAEIEELLGITTTAPDNTVTTSTQSGPPNLTEQTATTQNPPEPQQTDCDKYPDFVGCSKYGTAPVQEVIPVVDVPVSVSYTAWNEGSCPAPVTMNHGVTFDYTPFCNWLTLARPIIIGSALLMAALLIVSGVKD